MHQTRKDMSGELRALQERLRSLLRANMGEAQRTRALLRDTELKMEEQFGHLDFIETSWYIAAKKFRKTSIGKPLQNEGISRGAEHPAARVIANARSDAPRSGNGQALRKFPPSQDIAPQV